MSGECDKCGEHALECTCSQKDPNEKDHKKKEHYFIQIFLPSGKVSEVHGIDHSLIMSDEDPILNIYARRLSMGKKSMMVVWGCGQVASFMYENKMLRKMQ